MLTVIPHHRALAWSSLLGNKARAATKGDWAPEYYMYHNWCTSRVRWELSKDRRRTGVKFVGIGN